MHDEQIIRHSLDLISIGAIVSSFFGWLPHLAALLGVIWYSILIGEKVAKWLKKKKC